jgi:putative ABC transport system substrate-binding protein
MVNPVNPLHSVSEKHAREAAKVLRLRLEFVGVRTNAEFDHAFETIARERPGAMVVLADRVFLHNRQRIVVFAARHRLPAVYPYRELVDAGGLMCFGPNYPDLHRRAAIFVDKILKGAKPADLPIEQPTKFQLVINLKTAKALGLTIPPSLLARADQVIE